MSQKLCIFILIFLIGSLSIAAQTNLYDIISKKDTLGVLKVSKLKKGEHLEYNYHVDMKAKLLVNIHVQYTIKAIYDQNQLISASVDNVVNGKTHHSSDIEWVNTCYHINTKRNKYQQLNEKIIYSGIRLFFDEPSTIKKVFSEYTGHYGMIKNIEPNTYELTLHNNKKNKYYYTNGELVKASINNSLIRFDLLLRK